MSAVTRVAGLVSGAVEAQLARRTALIIIGLMLVRLVAAAYTPLTFDEAYYWTWSKNLAVDSTIILQR